MTPPGRTALAAIAAFVVAVGAASSGGAARGPGPTAFWLPGEAAVVIDTGRAFSRAASGFSLSTSVTAAGDVNGDGRGDLLIAAEQMHAGDEQQSALLYGGSWPDTISLPTSRARGFMIRGARVSGAGDVNGDGLDDVLRCKTSYANPGASVLFGRPGRTPAVASGIVATGGYCLTRAGDIDGDGRDDMAFADPWSDSFAVVYGRERPAKVDLARPGAYGFRIVSRNTLFSISPAGDVNGDGRADILVNTGKGEVSVLAGRRFTGTLDVDRVAPLSRLVWRGVRLIGSAASAGDVNGDGVDDIVVAEYGKQACVVFGRHGAWPQQRACGGPGSFLIRASVEPNPGWGAAGGGDLDGDGLGEVILVAPNVVVLKGDGVTAGAVYVVFGRRSTAPVNLERDARVIRIAGDASFNEMIGRSAAMPGDITGDGKPDIVVGGSTLGSAWVISSALPRT